MASILGAFAAGLLVKTIDLTGRIPHPQFQVKLEGIGFGFLIPVFVVATGIQFDLTALRHSPAALAEVPLFLGALLVARGVPAFVYARLIGKRRAVVAGLMPATTLTFVIVATQLGVATGQLSPTASASLLAAGLLSAAIFPALALKLMPTEIPPTQSLELEAHRKSSASSPNSRQKRRCSRQVPQSPHPVIRGVVLEMVGLMLMIGSESCRRRLKKWAWLRG
jgi:Kef-type K+ transport system membrane component KefB